MLHNFPANYEIHENWFTIYPMKMVLLGTGTSHGVPVIGCNCKVCRSEDPRDNRLRCSAYLQEPAGILIDVGPEFRIQALRYKINRVDALLLTHAHADHLHGIDDLRIFSHSKAYDPHNRSAGETEGNGLPVYSHNSVIEDIKHRFSYIFKEVRQGGGKPKINALATECYNESNPIKINGVEVLPVLIKHGYLDDSGWILREKKGDGYRSIVYLTDLNSIPAASIDLICSFAGHIEHLVIDGLRILPHSTHFSFEQALELADRLKPGNVHLTHITHNLFHWQVQEYVDAIISRYPNLEAAKNNGGSVGPAYDGLEIVC